jgi:hypothetical protein
MSALPSRAMPDNLARLYVLEATIEILKTVARLRASINPPSTRPGALMHSSAGAPARKLRLKRREVKWSTGSS